MESALRSRVPLAALALALAAGSATALQKESRPAAPDVQAQDAQAARPAPRAPDVAQSRPGTPALALASKLAGLPVVSAQGTELAKVVDTLVEPTGEIVLLVERSGGAGIVGVPLAVLRLRHSDQDQVAGTAPPDPDRPPRDPDELKEPRRLVGLTLAADDERLASAPAVAGTALDAIDTEWLAKVHAQWRDPAQPREPGGPTPADGSLHPEGRPFSDSLPGVAERQGAETPAAAAAPVTTGVLRAAALDGKDVQSRTGEGVGEVEDVVVNLPEAKVAYVVIDTGGFLGMGSVHHGVSLEALRFGGENGGLVLQIDDWKQSVDGQPGIDLEHLPVQPTVGGSGPAPREAPPPASPTSAPSPAPPPSQPRR